MSASSCRYYFVHCVGNRMHNSWLTQNWTLVYFVNDCHFECEKRFDRFVEIEEWIHLTIVSWLVASFQTLIGKVALKRTWMKWNELVSNLKWHVKMMNFSLTGGPSTTCYLSSRTQSTEKPLCDFPNVADDAFNVNNTSINHQFFDTSQPSPFCLHFISFYFMNCPRFIGHLSIIVWFDFGVSRQ